jgi:hypothetical protein
MTVEKQHSKMTAKQHGDDDGGKTTTTQQDDSKTTWRTAKQHGEHEYEYEHVKRPPLLCS